MVKIGDLVKYIGKYDTYRGKLFTVVEPYRYNRPGVSSWYCITNRMSYSRVFDEVEMEVVESTPQFLQGHIVDVNGNASFGKCVGVIVASNKIASIIRYIDSYSNVHMTRFIQNSKLRSPKK